MVDLPCKALRFIASKATDAQQERQPQVDLRLGISSGSFGSSLSDHSDGAARQHGEWQLGFIVSSAVAPTCFLPSFQCTALLLKLTVPAACCRWWTAGCCYLL
mmetsp:Transcript_50564/g.97786  ORF Transcript_50564/g.97786 Transcript_50564/m.97786 type:complete len:103 (-) Transcript_50564:11-319(-)